MYLDMYLHIEFAGVVDLDWNAKALLTVIPRKLIRFCITPCCAKLQLPCTQIHYNVSML